MKMIDLTFQHQTAIQQRGAVATTAQLDVDNIRHELRPWTDHIVAPDCGEEGLLQTGSGERPHAHRTRNTFAESSSSNKQSVCDVLATSDFRSKATSNPSQCWRDTNDKAIVSSQHLAEKLEFGTWPLYGTFRMWKLNCCSEVARVSYRPTQVRPGMPRQHHLPSEGSRLETSRHWIRRESSTKKKSTKAVKVIE